MITLATSRLRRAACWPLGAVFASLAAATAAPAQSTSFVAPNGLAYDVLPGPAAMPAGFSAVTPVLGNLSRAQTVFERSRLGFSAGTIDEVAFRRDCVQSESYGALTRTFTVRLAHTAYDPWRLPFYFDRVADPAATTVVFTGAVSLPAESPAAPGPAGWSVAIPLASPWSFDAALGNLVLDLESDGTAADSWAVDAHWLYAGSPGSEEVIAPGCTGSNGLEFKFKRNLYQLATGRRVQVVAYNIPLSVPAAIAIIGLRLPMPLQLPGAPECTVALSPLCGAPCSTYSEGTGMNCAEVEYILARNPSLAGAKFVLQWGYPDAAANPFGVVSSESVEFTAGLGPPETFAMQTNWTGTPGAPFGAQQGGEYGPIVRFTGDLH